MYGCLHSSDSPLDQIHLSLIQCILKALLPHSVTLMFSPLLSGTVFGKVCNSVCQLVAMQLCVIVI